MSKVDVITKVVVCACKRFRAEAQMQSDDREFKFICPVCGRRHTLRKIAEIVEDFQRA